MQQKLKGFCNVLGREFSVYISKIPSGAIEDGSPQFTYGMLTCEYINTGGKCNCECCSILEQNGIKR